MPHRVALALSVITATTLFATACAPAAPTPAPTGGGAAASAAGGQQARGGATTTRRPGGGGTAQGPGNLTRLSGTVQMVLAEGVWLTDGKNFGITPITRVTRGVPKQLGDLRTGESVNITAERLADGTLQAKEVNLLRAQQGEGQQRQNAQGGQGAQGSGQGQGGQPGQTGAQGQGQGGQPGQTGAQGQGQGGQRGQGQGGQQGQANAQGQNQGGQGASARGLQAERTLPDGSVVVMGTLSAVETTSLTVTAGSTQVRVALPSTTVVMERQPATLTDLTAGITISALLSDGDAVMVNLQ